MIKVYLYVKNYFGLRCFYKESLNSGACKGQN